VCLCIKEKHEIAEESSYEAVGGNQRVCRRRSRARGSLDLFGAEPETAFTGPIATALIAVAVVVCGMVFAFSEGQGKRQLAGIVFGGAMAIGAVRFMAWLFT
jgi:TrbC/VIRB2 pilin